MPRKQNGFTHIALVGAGVVLIAASGVGYYVYDQNKLPNLNQENASEVETLDFMPDSLASVKTVDEIRLLAANNLNGSTIIKIELELEHGQLVYKVKLSDGRVLMFDAVSGEALASTEEHSEKEQDEIPDSFVAGISIDQARQIALQQRPSKTIKKIELEMEHGVGVYSVRFTDSGRVDINATNGTVMKIEAGDHEDSSDSSNENESDDSSDDNSDSGSDDH